MVNSAQDPGKGASERVLQQVAADFLSSYSEFLNAASLLERRPQSNTIHPDTNRSLGATRWLLARAIGELDGLQAVTAAGHAHPKTGESDTARSVPPIISRAIEEKILTKWPEAENLLVGLPDGYGLTDVIPCLRRELKACLEAVSRVDLHSGALLWQLHAALSRFTDAMVKGQFLAIARIGPR